MLFLFAILTTLTSYLTFSELLTAAAARSQRGCNINNICFAIDQSGSTETAEYAQEQQLVKKFASSIFHRSASNVYFSAVAFSDFAMVIQDPTEKLATFHNSIDKPRLFNSSTSIARGLKMCMNTIQNAFGSRLVVIITDGIGSSVKRTRELAAEAKNDGMDIVTMGIGSDVDSIFLQEIASTSKFYFSTDFDRIMIMVPSAVERVCDLPPGERCEDAYRRCQFRFKGESGLTKYNIPQFRDKSFTPKIVSKNRRVRLASLNTNGIVPEFVDVNTARPITQYGSPHFTPTHFKPIWMMSERADGIGHQTFHGNQKSVALNRCIRVFFTHFQEFRGERISNQHNIPREKNKCVVFATKR